VATGDLQRSDTDEMDGGGSTRADIDWRSARRDGSSAWHYKARAGGRFVPVGGANMGEKQRTKEERKNERIIVSRWIWRGIELSIVPWTLPHVATRKRNVATS
jgi:hypothetical protein